MSLELETGNEWRLPHAGPLGWRAWRAFGITRLSSFTSAALYGLLLPSFACLVWGLAVRAELVAPQILPAPTLVIQTFWDLILSGDFAREFAVSMSRLLAGLAAGGLAGFCFGLLFGLSPASEKFLGPTLRAAFLVPSLGWLPFLMLVFGIGESLKFVLIAKTCFLPLMVNVRSALLTMPPKYRELSRCLELPSADRLRYVLLPALIPALAVALRQAVSKGWKVLILVEMISSAAGIGYLMMWGRKSFQLDVVFVTIVVVAIAGFAFDRFLVLLQKKTAPWSLHAGV